MKKKMRLSAILVLVIFLLAGLSSGLLIYNQSSDSYKSSAQIVFVDKSNSCSPKDLQKIAITSLEELQKLNDKPESDKSLEFQLASGIQGINLDYLGDSPALSFSGLSASIEMLNLSPRIQPYGCENVTTQIFFPKEQSILYESKRPLWIVLAVSVALSVVVFCLLMLALPSKNFISTSSK